MKWLLSFAGILLVTSAWAQSPTAIGGTSLSSGALGESVTATAQSSVVVLNKAGNVYRMGGTIGATPGFILGFDATSKPADGTVTPLVCRPVAASSSVEATFAPGPALRVSTGFVVVFSTGANCFSLTAASAFLWGQGQ